MQFAGVLLLIGFPVGPALLGLFAWLRYRRGSRSATAAPVPWWPGLFNATLAMALAFNLIYFVQEFFLAWPKSLLPGISGVVYRDNHNWSGEHAQVILYQGTGALAIIVLGLLAWLMAERVARRRGQLATLLPWIASMGLGLGLIQVVIAAMHPDNDVGQAMDYLALSPWVRNAMALLATGLAVVFGRRLARLLLSQAPSSAIGTPSGRVKYLFKFVILPLLLGTLLAWINRAPSINQLTMPLFSGLFILPWAWACSPWAVEHRESGRAALHGGISWPLAVGNLVLLAFYGLVLRGGLQLP